MFFYLDPEVALAEQIARELHANQIEESTGDPYIQHIERVVGFAGGMVADPITQAAAWLHDVIEDTEITEQELFQRGISAPVIDTVIVVTRLPGESYEQYIEEILHSENPHAIAIKKADLLDHLRPNCPPDKRPKYEAAWKRITGEDFRSKDESL